MIKRICALSLALIMMLCAAAQDVYEYDSDFEAIEKTYEEAREADGKGNLKLAYEKYQGLIDYTEGRPIALLDFKHTSQYYFYANGRLALRDKEYNSALRNFKKCSSKYVEDVEYFIQFITGIQALNNQDYETAVNCFKSATECDLLFQYGITPLLDEANIKQEEAIRVAKENEKRLQQEEAEKARLEAEKEARSKITLTINARQGKDGKSVLLSWNNLIQTYIVAISPMAAEPVIPLEYPEAKNGAKLQLVDQNDKYSGIWYVEDNSASSCSLEISGLWPGTRYYVWLYDSRGVASSASKSLLLSTAPKSTLFTGKSTQLLWQCSKEDYARCYSRLNPTGIEGVSPHGYMWSWNYTQRIGDNQTVIVSNDNLVNNSYYALISFYEMNNADLDKAKKALIGKSIEMYLHLNGIGTARLDGVWPVEQVLFLSGTGNESKFTVYLADLFDRFDSVPAQTAYQIEMLIDGKQAVAFSGVTQ